ncbi:uncharacterized protein METZ01_LOCUS352434, partial [marine metagenome]
KDLIGFFIQRKKNLKKYKIWSLARIQQT